MTHQNRRLKNRELLATPSPYITQNETETKFLVNLGSCLWTTDHAGDFIQFTAYWLPQEKQWVPGPVLPAHSRVLVSEDRRSAILLDQIPSEVNLECPKGTQSAYDEFAYWRKQWSLTYQQAWAAPR